jgi:hypothetical protein
MKNIYFILICILFVSCKQSIFLQRKYTDGFYFSKASSDQIIEVRQPKERKTKTIIKQSYELTKSGDNGDTIILVNGKKIPCVVKTIRRKNITYTDGRPGPVGFYKDVKSSNIASIHFKEGEKEYFNQPNQDGNPILQFGLVKLGKAPNSGMAQFGYIMSLLASIVILLIVPPFGFTLFFINLGLFISLTTLYHKTLGYKFANGVGKFYAWIFIISFIILLIALVIAF